MWTEAMQQGLFPFLAMQPSAQVIKHKCNLCGLDCDNATEYEQHLNSHFDHHCPYCDYTSKTEGRLKRHVKDLHGSAETQPQLSTTGQNSESDDSSQLNQSGQQKQRISKCKQCGFVAETKQEFWEHSKTHIKQGKMLECPQCPFVTEYKHHLEYHLRNHYGSKPFKCSKCNYSCVNKSMLNSHMKSHSNVYQYRCEDCNYATKYCHSLKLHLRKYDHKPAVVLNPDGTPNPYPIIDVYGTRRGPRPKKGPSPGPFPMLQAPFSDMASLLRNSSADWMNFPFCWPNLDLEGAANLQRDKEANLEEHFRKSQSSTQDVENSEEEEEEEEEDKSVAGEWGNAPLDLSRSSPHSPQVSQSRSSRTTSPSNLIQRVGPVIPLPIISRPPTPVSPSTVTPTTMTASSAEDTHNCNFCGMLFKDLEMFRMHKNFHSAEDPFKCNVCGHRSSNPREFFMHLTRDSHN